VPTGEELGEEKKKTFSFSESELEWINPLILEWTKENEGKKQGDFITQLLKDYKSQRENAHKEKKRRVKTETTAEPEKRDYGARVGEALSGTSARLRSGTGQLRGQLTERYEKLADDIGKLETKRRAGEAVNVASEKLRTGGQQISTGLKRGYEGLLSSLKKQRPDAEEEG
jgi:hypothetical protein